MVSLMRSSAPTHENENARDKPGHDAVFVDGSFDVGLRLARNRLAERGLGCGKAGDRHAIGRAGDVVEPDLVAERHGGRIAAMLTANADLQIRPDLAAAGDADLHQLANAVAI